MMKRAIFIMFLLLVLSSIAAGGSRFTDNGNGTITDTQTGLMWLKDANCFGKMETYKGAFEIIGNFNINPKKFSCESYSASYADWHVPTLEEIQSLVSASLAGSPDTWFKEQGFVNVQVGLYMCNIDPDKNEGWTANLVGGFIPTGTDLRFIWPVRIGQKKQ